MKKTNVFVIIALLYSCATSAQDSTHSIQRDDNDLATYYDTYSSKVNNPNEVTRKYESIVKTKSEDLGKVQFYSYRIKGDDTIDFYLLTIISPIEKQVYILVFDKNQKKVSNDPLIVNLKSGFNNEVGFNVKLFDYPLINVVKNDKDYFLFVRERVHNGNVYNAILHKKYLLKNLKLEMQFCYEEKSLLNDGTIIRRKINKENILEVFVEKSLETECVGKIEIDWQSRVIKKRHCEKDEFCEMLFTTSGLDEQVLLQKGSVLKY